MSLAIIWLEVLEKVADEMRNYICINLVINSKKSLNFIKIGITRHLKLKCLTLKIKNFKFASNLGENF